MIKHSAFFIFIILLSIYSSGEEVFSSFVEIDEYHSEKMTWVVYEKNNLNKSKIQISPIFDELSNVLNQGLILCINGILDETGMTTFYKLKSCGLEASVDLNILKVKIVTSKEGRKQTQLAVSGFNLNKPRNTYRPSVISGYFNIRALQELDNFDNNFNTRPLSGSAESVLNINGLVIENRFTYKQNDTGNSSEFTRDYSKITLDLEKSTSRLSIGDIDHNTRGFQNRITGFGLSYGKEFSINPRFFRSSFKNYSLFLDRPSTVEIYINGKLARTRRAPKGPLEITDFPFVSGENFVLIKVIDDFGEVKEVDFSSISDSKLLSTGVTDYSFNFIFPRKLNSTASNIQDNYELNKGVFSGFYQKGIEDNLMLGIESQIGRQGGLVGLETTYGNKLGISKLNLVSSLIDTNLRIDQIAISNLEYALRFENESLLVKKGALSNFRLNTGLEFRTAGFQTYDTPESRHQVIFKSSVAQNFKNSIRGSLGLSKAWGHKSSDDQTLIFSNFGWNFLKNWDFSSSIKVNLNDEKDTTVLLSLSWSTPVQNKQWLSTFDPQNETATSEFTYLPVRDTNNLKIRVGGNTAPGFNAVSSGIEYLNQRLEVKGNYSTLIRESGDSISTASFNAGVGLAFSGFHLALTRPIADSFAIIGMSKKPFGLKVPIDRYGRARRAEINLFGPAVISTLSPYFTDQISVDGSALPYGLTVKNESFNFRPTYKSGVYLDVAVDSKTSILGSVKRLDRGEIRYLTGKLLEIGSNGMEIVVSEFFTGSDGSFTIEGVKNKKYFIEFYDSDIKFKKIGIAVNKNLGFYELKEPLLLVKERL